MSYFERKMILEKKRNETKHNILSYSVKGFSLLFLVFVLELLLTIPFGVGFSFPMAVLLSIFPACYYGNKTYDGIVKYGDLLAEEEKLDTEEEKYKQLNLLKEELKEMINLIPDILQYILNNDELKKLFQDVFESDEIEEIIKSVNDSSLKDENIESNSIPVLKQTEEVDDLITPELDNLEKRNIKKRVLSNPNTQLKKN